MKLSKFKELIEEFVSDNFNADGCRECHEICHSIVPNEDKHYDKALKELKEKVINLAEEQQDEVDILKELKKKKLKEDIEFEDDED